MLLVAKNIISDSNLFFYLYNFSQSTTFEYNSTLGKLLNLWLSMFINFSIKPMRFITITGLTISLISVAMALFFIVEKIMNPQTVPGWTTIIVLLLFFGGLQSTFLGIIGEYIGKNYLDQNNTPQWVVKETFGV